MKNNSPVPEAESTAQCIWQQRLSLGEGIIWCPHTNTLLWSDILGGKLYRFSPANGEKNIWPLPEPLSCIVPCVDGRYLAAFTSGLYRCQIDHGEFLRLDKVATIEERITNRPNDGCCDYWGNFWFGTMDIREQDAVGAFYRFNRFNGLNRCVEDITITNGPAIAPVSPSAPQSRIYYTDTLQQKIYQADITPSGDLLQPTLFYQFSHDEDYPDGMTIDEDYHLWCCLWGAGKIVRISPAGNIVLEAHLPVSHVTKCVFAGSDAKGLYITTARKGLSQNELRQQPLAGSVFFLPTNVSGLPVAMFDSATTDCP